MLLITGEMKGIYHIDNKAQRNAYRFVVFRFSFVSFVDMNYSAGNNPIDPSGSCHGIASSMIRKMTEPCR